MCNSKTIKICPNQLAELLRFLFTVGSLKIKRDLELVSWSLTGHISLPDRVYFQSYSVKCVSWFMLEHMMTS